MSRHNTINFDRLWRHGRLATMAGPGCGIIEDGAIATSGGRIVFVGRDVDLPKDCQANKEIDLGGRLVTPGLIDCHTHLVFAGDRAAEFEMRLNGADYATIAREGGGILSTVRATRSASEDELVALAADRLRRLMAEGVTAIEIKSGYGLGLESELRMLRAARRLGREHSIDVSTTLLAAHALPPEFTDNRGAYIDLIVEKIIPAAAGLADAVDAFCESIAFTPEETAEVFNAAKNHGLAVKLHADQLSDLNGAALAAEHGALSADHLEWTNNTGIAAMARAGTVAVLLPGAFFALRETRLPPIAALRAAGVPIAVATDCNPGSSPLVSILAAMNMAAVQFRLTIDEIMVGVTRAAAQALGKQNDMGTLELGKSCDLAVWDAERPAELIYWMGRNPLHRRVWRGQ